MLKPSKKAGGAPLLGMNGHGPSKHPARPNSPDSTHNRVILSDAAGGSGKATFTAPRREAAASGLEAGFTKLGKA